MFIRYPRFKLLHVIEHFFFEPKRAQKGPIYPKITSGADLMAKNTPLHGFPEKSEALG